MPMYVERNAKGAVIAAWSEPRYPTQPAVSDDDVGLFRYMQSSLLAQKLAGIGLTVDDLVQITTRVGTYVDRGPGGLIVASYDRPQRNGHEMVPSDLPELQRFLANQPEPTAPAGYEFRFIEGANTFRILRQSDNVAVADGLESLAACAEVAKGFAAARHDH